MTVMMQMTLFFLVLPTILKMVSITTVMVMSMKTMLIQVLPL